MKISLKHLLNQNKLTRHKTSAKEVSNLLELVRRDLKDANLEGLSVDRRFVTAYNAVLQLAIIIRGTKQKEQELILQYFRQ